MFEQCGIGQTAIDAITGKAVGIADVKKGRACNCICPSCGKPLVARQGKIRTWHFAHATKSDCPYYRADSHTDIRTASEEPHLIAETEEDNARATLERIEKDFEEQHRRKEERKKFEEEFLRWRSERKKRWEEIRKERERKQLEERRQAIRDARAHDAKLMERKRQNEKHKHGLAEWFDQRKAEAEEMGLGHDEWQALRAHIVKTECCPECGETMDLILGEPGKAAQYACPECGSLFAAPCPKCEFGNLVLERDELRLPSKRRLVCDSKLMPYAHYSAMLDF